MGFRKSAFPIAVLITIGGCDCYSRLSAQAQAEHVMVATVLGVPEITVRREAIAGLDFLLDASIPFFDGGIPSFDGGCPFDGGCKFDAGINIPFSFDGGALTLAPQTAVLVFFGKRGASLASVPVGLPDASVEVSVKDGMKWKLKALAEGSHALTSQEDSTLQYTASKSWTFTATSAEGKTYVASVDDAPQPENIKQLHPDLGYIDIDANTDYVLTRPDPADPNLDRNIGIVTVYLIDNGDYDKSRPTWTNVTLEPLSLLKLVAAPGDFKKTVITIPGTKAFPERDRNYLIMMQSVKVGFASSENLFIGSPIIAGVADVGVVKTRK